MRFTELPTPCFLVDENRLVQNLAVLRDVAERTGAKILLAQKAFSMFSVYPLLREYLAGTTASGLYEARLGHEEFGGETHVYSPAYAEGEFQEILHYADHIVFNSFTQWKAYGSLARAAGKSCGLRVNPECSTQPAEHAIYDPCSPGSRLGITEENFQSELLGGIDGLHFHTLCEQNADDLVRTVEAFEERFGKYMEGMKWLNLGGGHHITRDDYDVETLVQCINYLREKYRVQIYLEPGEAVVLNAGYLISTVLEVMKNGKEIAILDTSAACHMPDVLEMPYRPPVFRADEPGKKAFTYLLTGRSCLAGDVIGEYSFDNTLRPGDQVVFEDMALYTMVKTNTFNGVPLPLIAVRRADGTDEAVRMFGYEDFKNRLS
ncbi:MAG TPA: carboxynorspermidine decarboxylase [Candidatus Agathobaculum merdipullorum]|nr:carboxynorspermidine decarboxylase [Candidatus Agathobaculum merdipullorum]